MSLNIYFYAAQSLWYDMIVISQGWSVGKELLCMMIPPVDFVTEKCFIMTNIN